MPWASWALLASRRESIHAAQSQLDLAKKDFYPDFKIGAFYGGRDDMLSGRERADFLSLKLSMNVPARPVLRLKPAMVTR